MLASTRRHLRGADESYFQHLRFAALVGLMLLAAGVACLLHAIFPALCRRSASGIVRSVGELMVDRSRLGNTTRGASGPLTLIGLLILCAIPAALLVSAGPHVLSLPLGLLLAGLPIAFLFSNPDLDPVA